MSIGPKWLTVNVKNIHILAAILKRGGGNKTSFLLRHSTFVPITLIKNGIKTGNKRVNVIVRYDVERQMKYRTFNPKQRPRLAR